MTDQAARDQLSPVTVLFVDISDSSAMYAKRGDTAAFTLTRKCLDVVAAQIRGRGGRVLRQVGDGVLAVFETPVAGLQAAIEISQATEDPESTLAREGVRVRSGLNAGIAVLADGDVYGDVANVAARLVDRADAGEIFLSGAVHDALPAELRDQVQLIDQMLLRKRPASVPVYRYVPDIGLATIRTGGRWPASAPTMELTYADALLVLGPQRPLVTMGRDAGNDICVDEDLVSRHHADIALHGDRFTLIDHSTNGTSVWAENGPPLRLVREEVVLTGAGRIVLGVEASQRPISYRVAGR